MILDVKPKTYQVPKSNHPWRQYINRKDEETHRGKPLKEFITEMAQNWDNLEIITSINGSEERFKIVTLTQSKQAAWLANLLKKN